MLEVEKLSDEELYILYYSLVGFDYTIEPDNIYNVYDGMKTAIEKEWIRREKKKSE